MPRYDQDQAGFIQRIDRRRRWAHRRHWARTRLGLSGKPLQAAVYDAAFCSDAEAVIYHYAKANDHMPDFEEPTWINEKVRWQFLHHPNPLMSLAADKIAVRDYLRWKGAEIPAPELIACGSDPHGLATAELPERFVMKSAYGSGQNHFHTGEAPPDRYELVAKAQAWAEWDQWRHTGELHYRAVPKRWLIEEFVPAEREALELKFFCLQGEPVFVTVITERCGTSYKRAVYDLHWNRLELETDGVASEARSLDRPADLDLLAAEARRLSEDFLHVRVDFLRFDGRTLFSELTFASLAAALPFAPRAANRLLGERMDLARAPEHLARGQQIADVLGWSVAA